MKYIQSFYQYPVTFSSINKGVPSKDADGELRNIAEFTDEELEKLEKQEPLFRALVNQKKYRVLNKLPESYRPASALVNEAREEAKKEKEENEKLKAELAALKANQDTETGAEEDASDISKLSYKELQDLAKEIGLEDVNVKKAVLVDAIKAAQK